MRPALLVLCLAAALSSACQNSDSSSSLAGPTGNVTTENFTGTVAVGGMDIHPFTVATSGGQVNVTLTSAGPPPTIYMGIGVGTYAAGACTLLSGASIVAQAGATAQLSGTVGAGSYCVEVYDAGNQTAQIAYAVTVSHF